MNKENELTLLEHRKNDGHIAHSRLSLPHAKNAFKATELMYFSISKTKKDYCNG